MKIKMTAEEFVKLHDTSGGYLKYDPITNTTKTAEDCRLEHASMLSRDYMNPVYFDLSYVYSPYIPM